MKKLWEVIKKVFIWLGAILSAVFFVLFIGDKKRYEEKEVIDDSEEINAKAAKKREEAIESISNCDARTLCESYGSVCDTIADGKERFRKRCKRADN